ncbi:unnamed protein product [Rhodiola kirilowii]
MSMRSDRGLCARRRRLLPKYLLPTYQTPTPVFVQGTCPFLWPLLFCACFFITMSHAGSNLGDDEVNNEVNPFVQHNEAPPLFYDDPEHLVRNRRRANREAAQRNQGPPEVRNGVGPRQPPRQPPPPPHQQPPR